MGSLQRMLGCAGHGKALDSDTEECYWPKQECFLSSSCPAAALAMRVELGQWAEALRLAPDLDPVKVPVITFHHAQVSAACLSQPGDDPLSPCMRHPPWQRRFAKTENYDHPFKAEVC